MTRTEWLTALPKLELHCHLDGSLPIDAMKECIAANGITLPAPPCFTAPGHCASLTEYLTAFDLPVSLLQRTNTLVLFTQATIREAAKDGLFHLELRFAPQLHTAEGLTLEQVFQAVELGVMLGCAETGIHVSIIACAMRHFPVEENLAMLEVAQNWHPHLVAAVDLAGDESIPTAVHAPFFHRAKELGIPFTIHSGETGNVENLREALRLGAVRVGHGIALRQDADLMDIYAKAGIGIELCPTSNLQTSAVADWDSYPVQDFLRAGLRVTVNTDNRTVSNTTLVRELELLMEHCGVTAEQVVLMMFNASQCAFFSEEDKSEYIKAVNRFLRRNPPEYIEE